MPPTTTEAFSRVKIDALLRDAHWAVTDQLQVRYEVTLPNGERADYVLYDKQGRPIAVLEAKRSSLSPAAGEAKARSYAEQLGAPFIFLSNGEEVWFWDWQAEAHPRPVATVFAQADLIRRRASREIRRDPLEVPIDTAVVERAYQLDCIDRLCHLLNQGRRKLLVEMATGTGKTRVAAALVKRLFEAGQVTRVLFLVDREELARQADGAFALHVPTVPAYWLRAGKGLDETKRITVATLQSLMGRLDAMSAGYFDLVVVDECHRSIYGQWRRVLDHFDAVQLGLTATPLVVAPCVLASLEDPEDAATIRDTLRFFGVDRPDFRYTLKQAIAEGALVPYQIYAAQTVKTAAEGGFPVARSELDWDAMAPEVREAYEELFGDRDSIVVEPSELERRFTIPERNRAIVREFRDVLEGGYQAAPGQPRRYPQDGKTIVFAVTKRHAETLARMFDEAFADRKPDPSVRYADFVVSGQGGDDTADAGTRINRFKREPFPRIMVSVNMLDTGFDCPEVVNLVMVRFTKSAVLYQQMRGRGTRKAPQIRKTAMTMFDFVGVSAFHGDDEEVPAEGGLVVHAAAPERGQAPRRLLVLDVHDHIDPASRGWTVTDEDGNLVPTTAGEARASLLGVRFEGWLASGAFTPEQRRLLRTVGEQVRANALSMDGFDAGRFTLPPFSTRGGYAHAAALFGGEAGLERMLDGLNAAVFGGPDNASDTDCPAPGASPTP